MSGQVARCQVDDEGHAVGVDIAVLRGNTVPRGVTSGSVPDDVRETLLAWLLPEGHAIVRGDRYRSDAEVERLCEVMHDAYERAAQVVGWETQARSRVPWSEVPDANKRTMRAAVQALVAAL